MSVNPQIYSNNSDNDIIKVASGSSSGDDDQPRRD